MKPLVRRAPNGRRYTTPSTPKQPALDAPPPPQREPRAKLTEDDVRAIRRDWAVGKWNQANLAYIHGVSKNAINNIVHRRNWQHVTPEPTPREQD